MPDEDIYEEYKIEDTPNLPTNHYFDNAKVEKLLVEYHKTGCTDIRLRDEIMTHAHDLIINIIRTHNLHVIYGGNEESSFYDLYQTAWAQIESVLYKFDNSPGHSKLFNLWSQVARTVLLAAIKKDSRDKKNAESYRYYLDDQAIKRPTQFNRFMLEARELCKYSDDNTTLLNVLEELYKIDQKPYEGLISKLARKSKMSRTKILKFMRLLRLMGAEFTDSPLGEMEHQEKIIKPSMIAWNKEDD